MSLFSILLFFFSYLQSYDHQAFIDTISQPLQNFCNGLLSDNLQHVSLYQAVACGTPPNPIKYVELKQISLWHLLVVSGGHFNALVFFLDLLKPIQKFPIIKFGLLILFCFWTGFQEPAVFSFVLLTFQLIQNKLHLKIPEQTIILFSGASCLLIFPNWCLSFSFLLSWLCRISLITTQPIKSSWTKGLIFYFLLAPISFQFGTTNSLQGILWNCLLGTALSFTLFPLACLLMIFPQFLGPICDTAITHFLVLTRKFLVEPQSNSQPLHLEIFWSWCYVCTLHTIYFLWTQTKVHKLYIKNGPLK
jgi:predicted membrane metal-binding protein